MAQSLLLFCICLFVIGATADFAFTSFGPDDFSTISLVGNTDFNNGEIVFAARPNGVGAVWHYYDADTELGDYVLPGFRTEFTFYIDSITPPGGDGIAFVLQSTSIFQQGTVGAAIGYGDYRNGAQGIPNSLAIEFDTLQDASMNDPNNNHCGVHNKGTGPNSSNENAVILGLVNTTIPQIQSANVSHTAIISYDANSTSLVVEFDGVMILNSQNFNLTNYITVGEDGTCLIGFTSSSTNTSAAYHITSWFFWSGNGTVDIPATIVYGSGLEGAEVNETAVFYLQLVDIYGYNSTASGSQQGIYPSCNVTDASDPTVSVAACTMDDNNDGSYTASYELSSLGDFNIFVTVNDQLVGASPYAISVSGPPYAPNCIASGPGLNSTIAGEIATFTIYTFDQIDNPVVSGGANFDSQIDGPQGIQPVTIVDNNDGTYTGSYNVTTVGNYSLSIQLVSNSSSDNINGSPFSVTCSPNIVYAPTSFAYGSGLNNASAGVSTNFYIQGVDAFGNNASTPVVTWNISLLDTTGNFSSGPTQTYLNQGLYQINYTINTVDTYSLGVSFNGSSIEDSPFTLTVIPGLPYAQNCYIINSTVVNVTAGVNQSASIQAVDQFGNMIYQGGATFQCSVSGPQNVTGVVTDLNNGQYTCQFSVNITGSYLLSVSLVNGGANTGQISNSPYSFSVFAGPPSGNSFAYGEGLTLNRAGTVATYTIQAVDSFGNNITQGGASWNINYTPSSPASGPNVTDNGDGTYLVAYSYNIIGNYSMNVRTGLTAIQGSPFTIQVTPGPGFGPMSNATGVGLSSTTAGQLANFQVFVYDEFGNPASSGSDVCSGNLNGPVNNVSISCTYSNANVYNATYNLTVSGNYNLTVTINGLAIQNSPFSVTCLPGPVYGPSCSASGPGLTQANAGEVANFTIVTRDQFSNPVVSGNYASNFSVVLTYPGVDNSTTNGTVVAAGNGTYAASYVLNQPTGEWLMNVRFNAADISGSPFTPVLSAGAVNPTTSYAYAIDNYTLAYEVAQFHVQAVDQFGNNLTVGGSSFFAQFYLDDKLILSANSTDEGNGSYLFTYQIDNPGFYEVHVSLISVSAKAVRAPEEIGNSPFIIEVDPGRPAANTTTAQGLGLIRAVAGELARFNITTRDLGGNPVGFGGSTFNISMTMDNTTVTVDYTDLDDGTYNCSYTAFVAGNYSLSIIMTNNDTYGQGPISGSPFNPIVVPGENCPQNSTVDGLDTTEPNVLSSFTIQAEDCFGNPITEDNIYYAVLIEGPDCTIANTTYVGDGLTNVTYIVTEPGNYSVVIQANGIEINGSPFELEVLGETESGSDVSSSSSSSRLYMILMIIFIVLYVLVLIALIAYVVFANFKKIQKQLKKSSGYKELKAEDSSD